MDRAKETCLWKFFCVKLLHKILRRSDYVFVKIISLFDVLRTDKKDSRT